MSFTEVALSVLYLLQEAKIPLSIEQMSHALAESSEYTYLDAAISVNNLLEKNLIIKETNPMGEFYTISVDGRISLAHLKAEIRGSVRRELSAFVKENFDLLNIQSKVYTRIDRLDSGAYQVMLRSYDKDLSMNDFILTAQDENEAKIIATNWERHADDAIAAIYSVLMKDI